MVKYYPDPDVPPEFWLVDYDEEEEDNPSAQTETTLSATGAPQRQQDSSKEQNSQHEMMNGAPPSRSASPAQNQQDSTHLPESQGGDEASRWAAPARDMTAVLGVSCVPAAISTTNNPLLIAPEKGEDEDYTSAAAGIGALEDDEAAEAQAEADRTIGSCRDDPSNPGGAYPLPASNPNRLQSSSSDLPEQSDAARSVSLCSSVPGDAEKERERDANTPPTLIQPQMVSMRTNNSVQPSNTNAQNRNAPPRSSTPSGVPTPGPTEVHRLRSPSSSSSSSADLQEVDIRPQQKEQHNKMRMRDKTLKRKEEDTQRKDRTTAAPLQTSRTPLSTWAAVTGSGDRTDPFALSAQFFPPALPVPPEE